MILDSLKNCDLYTSCHRDFSLAFEILKGAIQDNLPPAKYELGDTEKEVFFTVSVQEYETKSRDEGKFEAHQDYIDIQYIVSGTEEMEVCDLAFSGALTEYNKDKDVQFFVPKEKTTYLTLRAGDCAIFFPHDVHKPGISPEGEKKFVKKIVVKVKI